jgi:hypothetical protein
VIEFDGEGEDNEWRNRKIRIRIRESLGRKEKDVQCTLTGLSKFENAGDSRDPDT